jgi:hypothetical protein
LNYLINIKLRKEKALLKRWGDVENKQKDDPEDLSFADPQVLKTSKYGPTGFDGTGYTRRPNVVNARHTLSCITYKFLKE